MNPLFWILPVFMLIVWFMVRSLIKEGLVKTTVPFFFMLGLRYRDDK